jgi:hypothetical protein
MNFLDCVRILMRGDIQYDSWCNRKHEILRSCEQYDIPHETKSRTYDVEMITTICNALQCRVAERASSSDTWNELIGCVFRIHTGAIKHVTVLSISREFTANKSLTNEDLPDVMSWLLHTRHHTGCEYTSIKVDNP